MKQILERKTYKEVDTVIIMPFQKGNQLWKNNIGKKRSQETKEKMRNSTIKRYSSGEEFGFQKGHKAFDGTEKTQFKKGHNPWNVGLIGCGEGEENGMWKGDKVGYYALHDWISRKLGKAVICKKCGYQGNCHWANKSHEYKRDLNDWISLCPKCHKGYDKGRKDRAWSN